MAQNQNLMNKVALRFSRISVLALAFAISACVTVNVNLPESAVQKAADDFVNDLYKKPTATASNDDVHSDAEAVKTNVKKSVKKTKGKVPASTPAPTEKKSEPTTFHFSLFEEALAQELNTRTPEAERIKDQMRARMPQIHELKDKGLICETENGTLKAKGHLAGDAQKLIEKENDSREALYAEIQRANHLTERNKEQARKFFSGAFRQKSPPQAVCN